MNVGAAEKEASLAPLADSPVFGDAGCPQLRVVKGIPSRKVEAPNNFFITLLRPIPVSSFFCDDSSEESLGACLFSSMYVNRLSGVLCLMQYTNFSLSG